MVLQSFLIVWLPHEKRFLFCFLCIPFEGESSWTKMGMTDVKHLSENTAMHELLKLYVNSGTILVMLGSLNIGSKLDTAYQH
jgi:hypothetical protein